MKQPQILSTKKLIAACLLALAAGAGWADAGHDHGEAPAATGTASPRTSAHSDLFELVGVVDKGQMTVYLDRYATNEPVIGARVEYESGANKGVAQPQPDGTYLVKFDALSGTGDLPFTFTVSAGSDTDLLASELQLGESHDDHGDAPSPWKRWAGYGLAAAIALAVAIVVRRKLTRNRPARLNA